MTYPRVVLLPQKAQPFFFRHPWVYPGAIASIEGEPRDGDVVDLIADTGNFVARGIYNSWSKIRVRLYSWDSQRDLDEDFFRERLMQAIRLRSALLDLDRPQSACRLVFSEADGLSGLTVDRYDRWLTVQFTARGLADRREMLADLLMDLVQADGIFLRTERAVGEMEGLALQDGPLRGGNPPRLITIDEDGVLFRVNVSEGQKTGFYLDQRQNRQAVASLARNRRVLDGFCYTGGFGLHAARAGAREVLGIDVSETAIALARENAVLNACANVAYKSADVFDFLEELVGSSARFDMVILDPPKFARSRRALDGALRGYRRLQGLVLRVLESDGLLVMCCCSGLISELMLEEVLAQAAMANKRPVQILERRGQASDHPVALTCPESRYLKCLIARVP
jgi:23S rRNA (cytosine1962-C5)-methyltransferase